MSRKNMFYWQADRPFTQEQINSIFLQRKNTFNRDEVIKVASQVMSEEIKMFEDPINQGSVNIVCPFTTVSGNQGVIRVHPPQVKNEYFFVEAAAMKLAKKNGVPTPPIIIVDDTRSIAPFDFMVMEKVDGEVMRSVIEKSPHLHDNYLEQIGEYIGKLHKIATQGYGFFDNELARNGTLIGIHKSNQEHYLAALNADEQYHRLNTSSLNASLLSKAFSILRNNLDVVTCNKPTLVHNDIADWNTVVDGDDVVGILDWDECFSGDPVFEFATLSLFYTDKQMSVIKRGYSKTNSLPNDYDQKFPLYVLRYIVNKSKIAITKIKYAEKTSMHAWLENAQNKLQEIVNILDN